MAKNEYVKKIKNAKFYTRAKSERLLTAGADPTETFVDAKGSTQNRYTSHPNYHVRTRAWVKMGRPLPEGTDKQNEFLVSLYGKELPKSSEQVKALHDKLRFLYLKEALPVVVEEVVVGDEAGV